MREPEVELFQFPRSHFNEKVRWTLDLKRVPHSRTCLLPGPHAATAKKLSGQNEVPIVRFGETTMNGSARIIDELERRFPDPPLIPADPTLAARAREIQSYFDEEIAPKVRRSLFAAMLSVPGYIVEIFAGHRSLPVRTLYRASFPIAAGMIKKSMSLDDPEAVAAAELGTREGLEFVTKEAGPDGYLVGDSFSVADLAAAALLAPAANPPDSTMTRPEPMPPSVSQWTALWVDHPGTQWVHDMYRRHRPKSEHPR